MPAMKWRDRVAIERREPAGTITCRPVGLLGVLTGRQVYAWAVRDAGLSAKHSTLAQTINRQEAGGTLYTTVIFTDQQNPRGYPRVPAEALRPKRSDGVAELYSRDSQ